CNYAHIKTAPPRPPCIWTPCGLRWSKSSSIQISITRATNHYCPKILRICTRQLLTQNQLSRTSHAAIRNRPILAKNKTTIAKRSMIRLPKRQLKNPHWMIRLTQKPSPPKMPMTAPVQSNSSIGLISFLDHNEQELYS